MMYRPRRMQGTWFAALVRRMLHPKDVRWVVNSDREVGVEIFGRMFFIYKGGSIEYRSSDRPKNCRPLGQRELGESLVLDEATYRSYSVITDPSRVLTLPAGPELKDESIDPLRVPFWKRRLFLDLCLVAAGFLVGLAILVIGRCIFGTWWWQ